MPFLNSSQQTPLKTQKVSVYIDWGFGQGPSLKCSKVKELFTVCLKSSSS